MKPVSIARYLGQPERAPSDQTPPRPAVSLFRPRSLQGPPAGERGAPPILTRPLASPSARSPEERPERALFERRAPAQQPGGVEEAEIERRVAEAYTRGQREGHASGRAEAQEGQARELAAARERALADRREFQLNEYSRLATVLREGLAEAEEHIGAAVARILAPFLGKQVVAHIVDELAKAIQRLSAGDAPGLLAIRGPERVLALLRERIAALPIEVAYTPTGDDEVTVEARSTVIAAELKPWADLLAGFAG
jgi:hypothetical protein